jgi:hypothetical protein
MLVRGLEDLQHVLGLAVDGARDERGAGARRELDRVHGVVE